MALGRFLDTGCADWIAGMEMIVMDGSAEPPVPALPEMPKLNLDEVLGLPAAKFSLPPVPALPEMPKLNLDEVLGLPAAKFSLPPVPALPEMPKLNLDEVLGLPAVEVSLPPNLINKSYDDSRRNVSLELTLREIEPAFADQFCGAMLRSKEGGPDWLTQAAASFRKLLLSVLHTAAPRRTCLALGARPKNSARPARTPYASNED